MSVITITRREITDVEALQQIVQDGRQDVVQLGRGRMSGALTHIGFDSSFGIAAGWFSRGVRLRGVVSENRWLIGTLLSAEGATRSQQHEVRVGDRAIVAPGQDSYSVCQGPTRYTGALVAPDELRSFLATQPGALDSSVWRRSLTIEAADPATADANIQQLSILLAALAEHGPDLSEQTANFYKRNFLELLIAPIRQGLRFDGPHIRSAMALVNKVDRYIADAGSRPIHISELCTTFGVARRTLHRAFDEVLGIPPITFMRRKRLGDVHATLLMPGAATVKEIAIEHGFADLSRFAGAYRRMFGELPSQTLRRAVRSSLACLLGCCCVDRCFWLIEMASVQV